MREKLRDKTRDDLAAALNALGVGAEIAERGRDEERVGASWAQSLGVIDIAEGPVRWVNVVRQSSQYGSRWWLVYGAPEASDDLRGRRKEIKLNTLRRKSFPLIGRVTNITWTDNGNAGRLRTALSNDRAVKAFVRKNGDVEIRNDDDHFRGWTLRIGKRTKPSKQDWEGIRAMAEHLLASEGR